MQDRQVQAEGQQEARSTFTSYLFKNSASKSLRGFFSEGHVAEPACVRALRVYAVPLSMHLSLRMYAVPLRYRCMSGANKLKYLSCTCMSLHIHPPVLQQLFAFTRPTSESTPIHFYRYFDHASCVCACVCVYARVRVCVCVCVCVCVPTLG